MHRMVALEYPEQNIRVVFASVDRVPADRLIRKERRLRKGIDEFVHLFLPLFEVHPSSGVRSGKGKDTYHFVITQRPSYKSFRSLRNLFNSNGTKPILCTLA